MMLWYWWYWGYDDDDINFGLSPKLRVRYDMIRYGWFDRYAVLNKVINLWLFIFIWLYPPGFNGPHWVIYYSTLLSL